MLSHEEQRRLDDIAEHLHRQDPQQPRPKTRPALRPAAPDASIGRADLTTVLLGAVVLSVGVATMPSSVILGSLIAGLGCAMLIGTVRTARTTSVGSGLPGHQEGHNRMPWQIDSE